MSNKNEKFVPALGFDWATKFYDPLVRIFTREYKFKGALIEQAKILENNKILDLACGTGTLSLIIKERYPKISIVAVDADHRILEKAIKKAFEKGQKINFQQCFSHNLPLGDKNFDKVFSTLSFHHLTLEKKIKSIMEIKRVLKPGGEFHLADYGYPSTYSQKLFSRIIPLIDGKETTKDNLNGRLGKLLEENGFSRVKRTESFKTMLGTIRMFKAQKF